MHGCLNLGGSELTAPNLNLINVTREFLVSLLSAADSENIACVRISRHVALPHQYPINE
jgi:hypothetical protein